MVFFLQIFLLICQLNALSSQVKSSQIKSHVKFLRYYFVMRLLRHKNSEIKIIFTSAVPNCRCFYNTYYRFQSNGVETLMYMTLLRFAHASLHDQVDDDAVPPGKTSTGKPELHHHRNKQSEMVQH